MRTVLKFILCCLCVTTTVAQEKGDIRIEQENGKFGAVNVNLVLPEPPRKKKKSDREPLTRPWIVPPIYDSLVLVSTQKYYPSYNREYQLSLFVGRQGAYFTSFYENADLLYTQSLRREILKPIFNEDKKAVGFKYAPISSGIKSHPIAIQGENGKWAVGSLVSGYFHFSGYEFDNVDFEPVSKDVRSNEHTEKGTWIVTKSNKKFYIDAKGNVTEWIGNAKNAQAIVKDFHYGTYKLMNLFSKEGKYGILSREVVLPAAYDSIEAPQQVYDGYHGIAFARLNNVYGLFDLRSEKLVPVPIKVTSYKSFFGDVFLKSAEGKWYIFDGIKLTLDSTAYDYMFDNVPGRVLLMNGTRSMSYFGEKKESVVKGAGPGVVMPSANESYSYVLSNGLIHYVDNKTGLQGMKYADGRIFVHPSFSRVAPSAYTKTEVFNNPNSKPEEWLYEFTRESVVVIGSVDIQTHTIDGHSLCGKCSGYGYTYNETRAVVKGETKTYTTSPVQQLRSESFDVKTGTWTKTYSNVSEQVTTTTPDKVVQNVERVDCAQCSGKGRTNYIIKWDGKNYAMSKLP